jgi:hypothetical protein
MSGTRSYEVKYKVNNTTSSTSMHLYGPNESEAIAKLKAQGSVASNATVIILSIRPA